MKPPPQIVPPAVGDEKVMEAIFENSALPVGRKIARTETFTDLGYEWLDFVELCIELDVEFEEIVEEETFGRMKVEEMIVLARGKKGVALVRDGVAFHRVTADKEVME